MGPSSCSCGPTTVMGLKLAAVLAGLVFNACPIDLMMWLWCAKCSLALIIALPCLCHARVQVQTCYKEYTHRGWIQCRQCYQPCLKMYWRCEWLCDLQPSSSAKTGCLHVLPCNLCVPYRTVLCLLDISLCWQDILLYDVLAVLRRISCSPVSIDLSCVSV